MLTYLSVLIGVVAVFLDLTDEGSITALDNLTSNEDVHHIGMQFLQDLTVVRNDQERVVLIVIFVDGL